MIYYVQMKTLVRPLCRFCFAAALGCCFAFGAFGAGAAPKGEIALVDPSAAEPLPVILPDNPSPSQQYAAEEYAAYMGRVSGRTVRVLPPGSVAHGVRLVTADASENLGDDGFRLRVSDGGLEIRGSRVRGCLYGVYEVLERFGGCRWYASWCERVPRRSRVVVPKDLDDIERPAFEMRQPWWYDVKTHPLFAARNKVNGFNHTGDIEIPAKIGGDGFRFGGGLVSCHTFNLLCDPKEHFAAHPEYFSMVGGKRLKERTQLCLTNPDVLDLVTSNVLARIRRDPTARFFGVSQNDWENWCECPSCKALDDAEGSHAGTTLSFVNAIAERVEREFPDVTIETLAYMYTRNLPKTVRPRRNVLVCLCTWECDFASPLDRSRYSSNVAFCRDIADWRRCCPNLYVWDYVTDFANYPMPFADWDALVGNVRFFRDHGVKYLFEQGDGQGRHADFAELRAWLLAKLMWNPDRPVEPLLDDFFAGYYGKGAPFVRACFDEVRALGRSWAAERPLQPLSIYAQTDDPILTDAFLERAEKLWHQAEEATKDDPAYAYNVRMGAFAIASTRLERLRTRYSDPSAPWLADAPDFENDLARMRTWARRSLAALEEAGDIRLAEGKGQDAALTAAWKAILTPTTGLCRPAPRRSVTFGSDSFLLGESASCVTADGAQDGKAMKLAVPRRVDEVICWLKKTKTVFAPGESYRLRVRAKLARGAALRVAVLVFGNVEQTSASLAAREGEGGWAWYDVGEWIPDGTDFVSFMREGADANAEILVDSVEISRQANSSVPLKGHPAGG